MTKSSWNGNSVDVGLRVLRDRWRSLARTPPLNRTNKWRSKLQKACGRLPFRHGTAPSAVGRQCPAARVVTPLESVHVDDLGGITIRKRVRNQQTLDFARHYGVTVLTCQPADPATKGGVEASVKLAKADIVPKDTNLRAEYASFAEVEAACEAFMDEVNNREHRATRRKPAVMLAEEARGCTGSPTPPTPSKLEPKYGTWHTARAPWSLKKSSTRTLAIVEREALRNPDYGPENARSSRVFRLTVTIGYVGPPR